MASTRALVLAAGATAADTQTRTITAFEKRLNAREVAAWPGVSAQWVIAHPAGLNRPALPTIKLGKASYSSGVLWRIHSCMFAIRSRAESTGVYMDFREMGKHLPRWKCGVGWVERGRDAASSEAR